MEPKTSTPYDAMINELTAEEYGDRDEEPFSFKASAVGQRILASSADEQAKFTVAAAQWLTEYLITPAFRSKFKYGSRNMVRTSMLTLLRRRLPFTQDDVNALLHWCLREQFVYAAPHMIKVIEGFLIENKMTFSIREKIEGLILLIKRYEDSTFRKYRFRLQELSGETSLRTPFVKGEAWSDAALADLAALNDSEQSHWLELLTACTKATGAAPTEKWVRNSETLLNDVGFAKFREAVLKWFPLVDKPRTERIEQWSEYQPDPNNLIEPTNADILKGLVWLCAQKEDKEIARTLTALALSAYRKVPIAGPRCVRVGNACVWALGEMPGNEGVGQLALLKVKVKTGPAQKGIEKAFDTAAKRIGLPRDEIEEMAVPTYGLQEVGKGHEQLAGFTAEINVTGTSTVELRWVKPDGKRQSSVPHAVKDQQAEELKELNQAVKDIRKMLPAQATRIENLYLDQKRWPLATWRERYLNHPLVGTLARRLIWRFTTGKRAASGVWLDDQMVGVDGHSLKLTDKTEVELWHPLYETSADVVRWREFLAEHEVQQPFKQAHREIYLLTDAETTTRFYSNRFAAHILKQHQFHALCNARGWKNKLRLMVDDSFPPASREMPAWKLRAEFWIDGVGEDYGTDTTQAGTYLYLSTDQVRFYEIDDARIPDRDPLELRLVPPFVFSEIMRDVDLFVGVASVANDPTWYDGGPDVRYQGYWSRYSFGDISETAKTRKQVLERLVPRLKIADRCRFTDNFLVVRGDVRTYKIHLGSSNILMEPNDQYLCIVPGQGQVAAGLKGKVFLPFEGDNTLSIILSKAFLLAEDWKITDRSILSQIGAA